MHAYVELGFLGCKRSGRIFSGLKMEGFLEKSLKLKSILKKKGKLYYFPKDFALSLKTKSSRKLLAEIWRRGFGKFKQMCRLV